MAGNITEANISAGNTTWFGVCGQTASNPASSFSIIAEPGKISCFDVNVGSCEKNIVFLNLLFSQSPETITSLKRGNISLLNSYISDPGQDASATLPFSLTYQTSFGNVIAVPTTYTNAAIPTAFRMGYVQDQNNNIVIITQVVKDLKGFNGSMFDFQAMLPTNGSNTSYYVTVDLSCAPVGPRPSGGGGPGGGGVGTPISQPPPQNITEPEEPKPEKPEICIPEIVCGAWGPCDEDGYRYQSCEDLHGCSEIEIFHVEKCPEEPPAPGPEELEEPLMPRPQEEELPCLSAGLLLIIILILIVLYKRRKKKNERTG
ncbi:hypothetical protein JXA56_03885 [Candidatus Micrarchaeota archaeon]|nr:hypothetical protein [Candidatus Micrarchaeota archaeon]